ncbi:hypothetical protein G8J22_00431 [Lentilactobacillus hilgardii]|uniref:Fe-S cluster assembly protein SufD n=1 Tax=Lentilactobacillus hilgardii TaxID=1588 RepID=UPI00019C50E4|nr:Fe-S cluster assembly protein SufD [Lentilactobacillus hilgardii]EEI20548.1 FeS assembly protein SufD [Lentilactobacillus buchneri ATCC 11577]MCT3396275.1 Fe-S cluster assembly protein SufD [Lentilactobacillus hilgardii]QIR08497.1 hypothetical protein G8J22_00431 [Lentilactobacillus hilgardii]
MLSTKARKLNPALLKQARFGNEPEWLTNLRDEAWEQVDKLTLPVFDKVDYHSWPLLDFTETEEQPTGDVTSLLDPTENYHFVSVGKETIKNDLSDDLKSKGIILTDMKTAIRDYSELLSKYLFQKAVKYKENRLTAVNAALMNGGTFLYVPDNVDIKEPINLMTVQDSRFKENFVNHTLIVAGVNSHFSVLQRVSTIGEQTNPAHVTVEIIAEDSSYVKFSALDTLAKNTYAYYNRRGYLESSARIDWTMGVLNDGHTVADFDSDLMGDGSHTEMQTVALSTGKQVQGLDTQVTNYGRHSEGNILQRGVLLDSSTLIFNGVGKIIHGAHGAKAQQENRVLMLSPKAHGDANPILLIDENDVVAGHAASVGQINKKQLYYLMSRGLSKKVAKRLVVRGFLGVVLRDIPVADVREQMVEMMERKLSNEQGTE